MADRPLSEVLYDIVGNAQDIVRSEVRLAKSEVREQIWQARSWAGLICVGAVASGFALMFFLLTVVIGLSIVLPLWAAALVVAVTTALVAVVTLTAGLKRFHATASFFQHQEDVEWVKPQIK